MAMSDTIKGLLLPAGLIAAAEIAGRLIDFHSDSLAIPSAIVMAFFEAVGDGSLLTATRDTLAGAFAVLIAVLIHGRWRTITRRFELALNLAFVALLSWFISAPAIFARPATDEGAKGCLVLLVAAIILDSGLKLYRRRVRFRTPDATAG